MAKQNYTQRASNVAGQVSEMSREIWLAGLGAYSRTFETSTKMFDELVTEGRGVQQKTTTQVNGRIVEIRKAVESRVNGAQNVAKTRVKSLEGIFEDRVARVLAGLGVPTSDDIQALSKRVASLNKEVKELNKQTRTTRKAA